MKCEFCQREIESIVKSFDGKCFCSYDCLEKSYIIKIDQLTKSEKAWHEEWYNLRKIIGNMGCKYIVESRFDKNKGI